MKHYYRGDSEVVAVCSNRDIAASTLNRLRNHPHRKSKLCFYMTHGWNLDDSRLEEYIIGRLSKV